MFLFQTSNHNVHVLRYDINKISYYVWFKHVYDLKHHSILKIVFFSVIMSNIILIKPISSYRPTGCRQLLMSRVYAIKSGLKMNFMVTSVGCSLGS